MPTYANIDSQSVKTASSAHDKGFDGGKKIKGRKRHIAVDTLGNLLSVVKDIQMYILKKISIF
ncbi:hypothetical protein QDY66_06090 [Kingella negevensis]|uniref:transposase n=1 Tax=Kingella negevensis TaxID=1522312 RepID=UPI00254D285D|nr:transposase [Kingella negevensis]MDK4699537.1 hypothetical protein [Kingella negevensis]